MNPGTTSWIEEMKVRYKADHTELINNMRNSENIVNASKGLFNKQSNYIVPEKSVYGPNNYWYNNSNIQLEAPVVLKAAVNKYFPHSEEPLVILFSKDSFTPTDSENLYKCLTTHFNDRKIAYLPYYVNENYNQHIEDAKEFLKHEKGIFLTETSVFHGAQARDTIIFDDQGNFETRNTILRTMALTVIITNNLQAYKSPGLREDFDLHDRVELLDCFSLVNEENHEQCKLLHKTLTNHLPDIQESVLAITGKDSNLAFSEEELKPREILFLSFNQEHPHTEDSKIKFAEQVEDALQINGSVVVLKVESDDYLKHISRADNVVIFSKKEYGSSFRIQSRNFLLRNSPKYSIIIHDGHIEEISQFLKLDPIILT